MPADTPPNCSNAFRHRRRMIREGYDRIMARVLQKQTKEIVDYIDKISKCFDPSLLPEPRPIPSHHHLVTGQQYVRQNIDLFNEALAFVQTNADNVEDDTPTLDDLEEDHGSKEAKLYKAECQVRLFASFPLHTSLTTGFLYGQAQLDAGLSRLRVKHEVQRSHILMHSTYMLHKVLDEQDKTLSRNNTPPRTLPPPIHSINAKRDPRNRAGYRSLDNSPTTTEPARPLPSYTSPLAKSTAPRPPDPNITSTAPESPRLPNQPSNMHKRSRPNE